MKSSKSSLLIFLSNLLLCTSLSSGMVYAADRSLIFDLDRLQSETAPDDDPFSLDIESYDPNLPMQAAYLINLCSSTDKKDWLFCDGYLAGTTYIWKESIACESDLQKDQSFCSGSKAAASEIQRIFESCDNCDLSTFRNDLDDPGERVEVFNSRMEKFRLNMEIALGACEPGKTHDEYYCMGYNAKVDHTLAELAKDYVTDFSDFSDAKVLGMGIATTDFFVHLFASREIYEYKPSINIETGTQEVKKILLNFFRDHPQLIRGQTATLILAKALFYHGFADSDQPLQPHMEHCTNWEYRKGQLTTNNVCKEEVFLQFLVEGQPLVERLLKPGEVYLTGFKDSQLKDAWWIFTACPVGYVSSPPCIEKNKSKISSSLYHCIKK